MYVRPSVSLYTEEVYLRLVRYDALLPPGALQKCQRRRQRYQTFSRTSSLTINLATVMIDVARRITCIRCIK